MRFGLVLPFSGDAPRMVADASRAAELGFDGVFATDHLFVPRNPERATLEPFSLLSAIAVACPELHVGTLVARVGLRHPSVLARMSAALDELSGGRAIIGLGGGDSLDRPENEAFGLPSPIDWAERLTMLTEHADVLRALFRGQVWSGGDATPAINGRLAPMPGREGGPPIWFGGLSEEVVRLAAEHADGWNGWGVSADIFRERARMFEGTGVEATWAGIATLGNDPEDAARRVGERRSRGLPEAWAGDVDDMTGFLTELAEAGATWAMFRMPIERAEVLAGLFAEVR